jgi:hypothetical protein
VTCGDTTRRTAVNIARTLSLETAFEIDSLAVFSLSHAAIIPDSAAEWAAALTIGHGGSSNAFTSMQNTNYFFDVAVKAPSAETGIDATRDTSGDFTMLQCSVQAKKRCLFLHGVGKGLTSVYRLTQNQFTADRQEATVGLGLAGVHAHAIKITNNTLDSVRSAIAIDSVNADSIAIDDNVSLPPHNKLQIHATVQFVDDFQGETTSMEIRHNTVSAWSADSGTGVTAELFSIGSLVVSDNLFSSVFNCMKFTRGGQGFDHSQGSNNIIIRLTGNSLTGSDDPAHPSTMGIEVDSTIADSIIADNNVISGYKGGVKISRCECPPDDLSGTICSISHNSITCAGPEIGRAHV